MAALIAPCPFCGAAASGKCPGCGRDPTARRRVCTSCKKMTPIAEARCCHCGVAAGSEMPGKVVLIILMFAAALVLSVVLAIAKG